MCMPCAAYAAYRKSKEKVDTKWKKDFNHQDIPYFLCLEEEWRRKEAARRLEEDGGDGGEEEEVSEVSGSWAAGTRMGRSWKKVRWADELGEYEVRRMV